MSGRRLGVYVCRCGGNISDYVDVEQVAAEARQDPDVVVARTAMFTCSDATQQEIVKDIEEHRLDGLVVASCSPKLHKFTFREVAKRAGLNPYQYTQVNIREQCSWAHTNDKAGATCKAGCLTRAGIGRTRFAAPLEALVVQTEPSALVIGGGIAGLRAALGLADLGLSVFLVEKESSLGGWVGRFEAMYPHGKKGKALIAQLVGEIRARSAITVFTNTEVVGKSGSTGNYMATLEVRGNAPATIQVKVGAIIVATGFASYTPEIGEFGYGLEGVVTLPEFKELVEGTSGPLCYLGRPLRTIVYVYCVGSRQGAGAARGSPDCSRYCCAAAVHASLAVAALGGKVHQYHLYSDMRTYGRYEALYGESRDKGSLFPKFAGDSQPVVARDDSSGGLIVTVTDLLTAGQEVVIPADLVVLVTGMVPRPTEALVNALKLPTGTDGFFHEIHPKLRPVETVVDGVYICGACQGPKNSSESVASGLAAVAQSAAILKKGYAELDPQVARVDPDVCIWCGKCLEACPYRAVELAPGMYVTQGDERPGVLELSHTTRAGETPALPEACAAVEAPAPHAASREVAWIDPAMCKGCGACVPMCPTEAVDLLGYTGTQVKAMIDGLLEDRGA